MHKEILQLKQIMQLSLGSSTGYVRGYRIKTLSPKYVDLAKPRDIDAAQNTIIPFELGNFSLVENVFGFVNTSGSTIAQAYQTLELHDRFTATPGDAVGNVIGYARVASLEHVADPNTTFGDSDDRYKMNLFDIQMFTILDLASAQTIGLGSLVVGSTSGARGYVVNASTGDHVTLYSVEGDFQSGEMITVDGLNKDTITNVYNYQYSDTRQVLSRDERTNAIEFTADVVLEDLQEIQGSTFTYDASGGSENITGQNSNFSSDLRSGDRIYFSATKYVDVDFVDPTNLTSSNPGTIFNYANQTVNVTPGAGGAAPSAGDYSVLVRYRAKS